MPGRDDLPTTAVAVAELERLALARLGQVFPAHQAEAMAGSIVFAELAGRATHGIIRLLPGRFGPVDEEPGPDPAVDRLGPTTARVTGRPAALVAGAATDLAIEIARSQGMAAVTVAGSRSSSGCLAYYVERLTGAGMVGIMAASTGAFVAPPGGTRRLLGTNPIAIGLPTRGAPFILDMGTAAITFGDVAVAVQEDRPLPAGVAVDAQGDPTTDPAAALHGALLAFGGHRGLGLSMAVELLAGGLSGAMAAGGDPDRGWGHLVLALSLEALGDADGIRADVDDAVGRIRSAPTRDGTPVRIPGRASIARRDEALARGTVEVDRAVLTELRRLVGHPPK